MKHVWASVPLKNRDWEEVNDRLTKLGESVMASECGAGTGFGYRDMDWVVRDKEQALRLKRKIVEVYFDAEVSIEDDFL